MEGIFVVVRACGPEKSLVQIEFMEILRMYDTLGRDQPEYMPSEIIKKRVLEIFYENDKTKRLWEYMTKNDIDCRTVVFEGAENNQGNEGNEGNENNEAMMIRQDRLADILISFLGRKGTGVILIYLLEQECEGKMKDLLKSGIEVSMNKYCEHERKDALTDQELEVMLTIVAEWKF